MKTGRHTNKLTRKAEVNDSLKSYRLFMATKMAMFPNYYSAFKLSVAQDVKIKFSLLDKLWSLSGGLLPIFKCT